MEQGKIWERSAHCDRAELTLGGRLRAVGPWAVGFGCGLLRTCSTFGRAGSCKKARGRCRCRSRCRCRCRPQNRVQPWTPCKNSLLTRSLPSFLPSSGFCLSAGFHFHHFHPPNVPIANSTNKNEAET